MLLYEQTKAYSVSSMVSRNYNTGFILIVAFLIPLCQQNVYADETLQIKVGDFFLFFLSYSTRQTHLNKTHMSVLSQAER